MRVVAGLSLKNLQPRVWDPRSEFYLPKLQAVMVSYADFHQRPGMREAAMSVGLRQWLCVPEHVQVYLDNGSFYFMGKRSQGGLHEYEAFVEASRPDWWPIPRDFIPHPKMSSQARRTCYERTMQVNTLYGHDGFVPVVHMGTHLKDYLEAISRHPKLSKKPRIALGGIVPNLLRSKKALSYSTVLQDLRNVRQRCLGKQVHVFGIGGTATLHLASVLGVDSADSSGWRNRAARGIVQLPGSGDRMVAALGRWRGRHPIASEWERLKACSCPACTSAGLDALKADGMHGFAHRAAHNLWVLLEEAEWIVRALQAGEYRASFATRLDNSTYFPLVRQAIEAHTTA